MKQTLIDIDNKILNNIISIKDNKVIISSNSGNKYIKLWQKEYKKLGRPKLHPEMADELIDYQSINLILSQLGAYGERMKRKANFGELGEFPLELKHKQYELMLQGMDADTAQKFYIELFQTQWQSIQWQKNNFDYIKNKEQLYTTTKIRLTDQGHKCHGIITVAKPFYIDGNALDKIYYFLEKEWPKSATAEQIIEYVFGSKDPNKRSFLSPYNNGQKIKIIIILLRKLGIIE